MYVVFLHLLLYLFQGLWSEGLCFFFVLSVQVRYLGTRISVSEAVCYLTTTTTSLTSTICYWIIHLLPYG